MLKGKQRCTTAAPTGQTIEMYHEVNLYQSHCNNGQLGTRWIRPNGPERTRQCSARYSSLIDSTKSLRTDLKVNQTHVGQY